MIQCPFCLAPVDPLAVACRSCGRDLAGLMHVLRRLEALTDVVTRVEAAIKPVGSGNLAPMPYSAPGNAGRLAIFGIAPVLLLMAAHYLIVFALDLRPGWLLAVTLLIPLAFGASAFRRAQHRFSFWLLLFLATAVAAVIGMNLVTAAVMTDSGPILPSDPLAWRETAQFTSSIFLGFLCGYLSAYLLLCLRNPDHERIRVVNGEFRDLAGQLFTSASATSVERAGKYLASLMSIVSATGAIYFGVQRF